MSTSSRLEQAFALLRTTPGAGATTRDEATWPRFLRVIFGIADEHPASQVLDELLRTSPLESPRDAAAASAGQFVEILKPIPRGPQKASVVRAVAAWWLSQFESECSPLWSGSVEKYREALRQIRGLGPATVDELLLFAAGLPLFPVDRTALRVAVRHGWIDLPVEDEEAQSFFVRGLDRSVPDLQELSRLLTKVGDSHCGREPQCEGCPLQSLLPEGGPRNPQSC